MEFLCFPSLFCLLGYIRRVPKISTGPCHNMNTCNDVNDTKSHRHNDVRPFRTGHFLKTQFHTIILKLPCLPFHLWLPVFLFFEGFVHLKNVPTGVGPCASLLHFGKHVFVENQLNFMLGCSWYQLRRRLSEQQRHGLTGAYANSNRCQVSLYVCDFALDSMSVWTISLSFWNKFRVKLTRKKVRPNWISTSGSIFHIFIECITINMFDYRMLLSINQWRTVEQSICVYWVYASVGIQCRRFEFCMSSLLSKF